LSVLRGTLVDMPASAARARGCAPCAHQSPLPARGYAALFGYYLGDGSVSTFRGRGTLRISCDRTYPRIIDDVSDLIRAVRPEGQVFHVRAPGAIVVQSNWKHWTCLFPQHGPGRKHERALGMAPWQREIWEAYPAAFLRGLFHSDGCRAKNWTRRRVAGEMKRYDYPRWQFTNTPPRSVAGAARRSTWSTSPGGSRTGRRSRCRRARTSHSSTS